MSVWGDLQYLPLGQPHFSLLTAIYFVLVAWILVRAFRLASTRIGLGSSTALILLAASLAGSYLNIPVVQLPQQHIISGQVISFYGMHYVVPVNSASWAAPKLIDNATSQHRGRVRSVSDRSAAYCAVRRRCTNRPREAPRTKR
jgi:hypothetical protein